MADQSTSKERLRNLIGCFMVENDMNADNLAVVLCTYFEGHVDRPKPDPRTENGWGAWAEREANRVLDELAVFIEQQLAHELPAALDLPEPHYNRADNIMEMSPEQWVAVRIAFGALRQQMQRAAQPPVAPVGWCMDSGDGSMTFTQSEATGRIDGFFPVYRAAQPPVPDDIERRARARFLENHGIPACDPWEHAPSATRHEYLEWARNNTPTKAGEYRVTTNTEVAKP